MKKSKIIVPALGILLLSTAASISGTVAWFTANRTFNFKAGEFAVVNTKNNLNAILSGGIGTQLGETTPESIKVKSGYKLTDASFDHTSATEDIIIPDDEGYSVLRVADLASAEEGSANTGDYMWREANTYSAFTWDVTFKLTFSASENKYVGLFFDASKSYTKEVIEVTGADVTAHRVNPDGLKTTIECTADAEKTAGNYYAYQAKGDESGSGWYTNTACSTDAPGTLVAGTTYYKPGVAAGTYYKAEPDNTGKAFRIAMVPWEMDANCFGITKVWAPNQTNAKSTFVDGLAPEADLKDYAGAAYDTATTSKSGTSAISTDSAGSGKVLMDSTFKTGVPTTGDLSASTAKSSNANYVGYFYPNPGNTVSMKFKFVAWYEGTDENIVNNENTIYETVTSFLEFGTYKLTDTIA